MKISKKMFPAFAIIVINSILERMTTKNLSQAVLFIAALFFFSCTQPKEQEHSTFIAPKVTAATGYIVPNDSIKPPKVVVVDERKLKKVKAGTPKVRPTNTNIHSVGKPKIVLVGTPRVCIPGQDTFLLPKTVPAIDRPFVAGIPEVVIAKEALVKDPNPAGFSSFSKLQGLKHSDISCMLQDKSGNIWFGTYGGGVSKYDGKFFTHFTEVQGLSNNYVQSILEDKSGNLWFGTGGGGVSRLSRDGKSFTHFTEKEGLSHNYVNCILEDKSGNIWFGTEGGVSRLSQDGKSFTHFTEAQGLSNNDVWSILEDKIGNLWFGTYGGGVSRLIRNGTSFTHFTKAQGLSNNVVRCILEDKNGNLWFGTEGGGVSRLSRDGIFFTYFTKAQGLSNNDVRSILEDKIGNLWFGTRGGGVSRLSRGGTSFTHFTEAQGLCNNVVQSILEDKSGNMWFGTYIGGVSRLSRDGASFTHFTAAQGFSNDNVLSILEDKNGNLWFGIDGGGVSRLSRDGRFFMHFTAAQGLSNNEVQSILEDKSGNLWFGTWGGGVARLSRNRKFFTHFTEAQGLSYNKVNSILEDKSRNIWFGTNGGGVSRLSRDGTSFTHFTKAQGLSNNDVLSILEDKSGNIWFGTDGGGVSRLSPDGKSFTHFTKAQGLSNNEVKSILEDKSGNIWFGTGGGGVSRLSPDGKSFTHFTEKEGLSNNVVLSILEDKSGNIWFGTRFGLSRLSQRKLAEFNQKVKSGQLKASDVFFKNYTYEDGFLGIGCNPNALFEAKDGTIWIGANDRLTAYHPPTGKEIATVAPNIQLTGIALFNENIAWASLSSSVLQSTSAKEKASPNNFFVKDTILTLGNGVKVGNFTFESLSPWYNLPEKLSLAYNNNYLTFNFIGITMARPKNVKYQYKLEGIDQNWSALTSRNEAPYGNLPQGNYTFKVKAMNSEGVWSDEFAYNFSIRPPWWKTWWAYCLYALLIGGSIRGYILYRSKALRRENLILEKKVTLRTVQLEQKSTELEKSLENLKSTQNQLIQKEKLASLGELTAGIAHEIQNPLNFVNNFSEMSVELIQEIKSPLTPEGGIREGEKMDMELIEDVVQNLQKINHHGKRASSIVSGMLEHSRNSTGERAMTDINKLADEYLRLSYHGMRAKNSNFNADYELIADSALPLINVVPQDMGRVLLNLINNAFYAVHQRNNVETLHATSLPAQTKYQPTVTISTQQANNQIIISVTDNGTGMSKEIQAKIFQPFFTTKPTGEGTGLGLSLAYDIVTKGHGGTIEVESKEGEGTVFIVKLPLQV